jgi:predicted sugar kinase
MKQAIAEIHAIGFKRREVENQAGVVRDILELLNHHDQVVAGMSSMGPLVYAIAPADTGGEVSESILRIARDMRVTYLGSCSGRNSGHEVL